LSDSIGRRALMSRRQHTAEQGSGEQGFVLETGGRTVLAFLAGGIKQARELCTQDWFVEELASYRSSGLPIWDGTAELGIRRADASEAAELQIALAGERARKEYEGYVFVFFVAVDAEPQ
jgi:hypothetical protein